MLLLRSQLRNRVEQGVRGVARPILRRELLASSSRASGPKCNEVESRRDQCRCVVPKGRQGSRAGKSRGKHVLAKSRGKHVFARGTCVCRCDRVMQRLAPGRAQDPLLWTLFPDKAPLWTSFADKVSCARALSLGARARATSLSLPPPPSLRPSLPYCVRVSVGDCVNGSGLTARAKIARLAGMALPPGREAHPLSMCLYVLVKRMNQTLS